jgi:hypothetical protein
VTLVLRGQRVRKVHRAFRAWLVPRGSLVHRDRKDRRGCRERRVKKGIKARRATKGTKVIRGKAFRAIVEKEAKREKGEIQGPRTFAWCNQPTAP